MDINKIYIFGSTGMLGTEMYLIQMEVLSLDYTQWEKMIITKSFI